MKWILYAALLALVMMLAFLSGFWFNQSNGRQSPTDNAPRINDAAEADDDADTLTMAPGTLKIAPDRQQLIGITVETVRKEEVQQAIRILGRVEADENCVYRINAGADGWIQKTHSHSVGSRVKKGEVLATFSTPLLADTMQNYFYAMETAERLEKNKSQIVHRSAEVAKYTDDRFILQRQVDLLRGMGVEPGQIEEINRTRKIALDIRMTSPAAGFITARKVSPNEHFEKGDELFRIVNLDRVWIIADVFESETRYFKPGSTVTAVLPENQKTYTATVSDVLPIFDAVTRTFKVRLEAENPDYVLRPDMFLDLEVHASMPPAIAIPADSVMYSGLRQTVFVERGKGYFEPRQVETGWRMGDRIEVVHGLAPGERIVAGGNFFVNSESRLQAAALGIYGALSMDPVCGMEVDETRARASGYTSDYQGQTYFFCAAGCKASFDEDPAAFLDKADTPDGAVPMTHGSQFREEQVTHAEQQGNNPSRTGPVKPHSGMPHHGGEND